MNGPWLNINSTPIWGMKAHPFEIRVPLASVKEARIEETSTGKLGAGLVFSTLDGTKIKLEIAAGWKAAQMAADRFTAAAARAKSLPPPSGTAGITSSPAPPRLARGKAWIMLIVVMVPWVPGVVGNSTTEGWGAAGTFAMVMLTLILFFVRSPKMGLVLSISSAVLAVAFGADYLLQRQAISGLRRGADRGYGRGLHWSANRARA